MPKILGLQCDDNEGTTTVICEISGRSNPAIKWYTPDEWINPADSNFTVNEVTNGNTLTSRLTMTRYQSDVVTCFATELNSDEYAFGEDCLFVTSESCGK